MSEKENTGYPLRFATEADKAEAERIARAKRRSLNSYLLGLFYQDRQRQRSKPDDQETIEFQTQSEVNGGNGG